jgi:hypothetical protein
VIECPFHGIGCTYKSKRSEMQAHVDSQTTVHVSMAVENTQRRLTHLCQDGGEFKRLCSRSYEKLGGVTISGFDDVCQRVAAVENKLEAVADAVGLLVETLVSPPNPAASAKAARGAGSSAKQPVPPPLPSNRKASVLKRLRDDSTPPGRQAVASPRPPGAPLRLPALADPLSGDFVLRSPDYSPTSPVYSPGHLYSPGGGFRE